MNKRNITLVLGSLAIAAVVFTAIVFGAAAYRSASAAEPVITAGVNVDQVNKRGDGREFGGGVSSEDLATALGITTDQLSAAYETANQAAIDQALEAGLITQAQADEMKTSGKSSIVGKNWKGWLIQNGIDYDSLLAGALGISIDDLQAAYMQAYNANIDQAVADGQLTQEQADLRKGQYALFISKNYQSAMQTAFDTAVRQAVTDGVITQSQADLILANQNNIDLSGGRGFDVDGFSNQGVRHGGHGGMGGVPPANDQAPAQPSATPSTGG